MVVAEGGERLDQTVSDSVYVYDDEAVLTQRMRQRGQLGGALTFEQHGMGETFDAFHRDAGDRRHLGDAGPAANAG